MEAENAEEDGRRTVAMLERKVARLQEDANRYARESIMKKWQHAKRNVGEHEGPAVSIPPGGSVGPGPFRSTGPRRTHGDVDARRRPPCRK